MYNDYFGFREAPFNITPDPRFFYADPVYQEAYASLLYGIQMRKGFIVLTGEVGVGKTTLLRKLMDHLDASVRFAFFYNTTLTFEELLSFACEELGLAIKGMSRLEKIQALNVFLINQLEAGGTGVLLIDEAQNLRDGVLEDLRLLSNLETRREKLLQIVLAGQPELQDKLEKPQLRQLKQRVAVWCQLDRLQKRKISPFIEYRLHAAGYEGKELFTPQALQRIALYSEGIPRLINVICDASLLIAYGSSQKTISAEIIEEAAQDLHLQEKEGGVGEVAIHIPEALTPPDGRRNPAHQTPQVSRNQVQNRITKTATDLVPGQRKRFAWAALLLGLLVGLGGGGVGASLLKTETPLADAKNNISNFIEDIREQLENISLIKFLLKNDNPENSSTHFETKRAIEIKMHSPSQDSVSPDERFEGLEKRAEPGFLSKFQSSQPEDREEREFPLLPSDPSPPIVQEESSTREETGGQSADPLVFVSQDGVGQKRIMQISEGTTVLQIAHQFYGQDQLLGVDLIGELNPHIKNLDLIVPGQKLWVPPLTREVLQRRQQDGSYRLILASFLTAHEAHKFVRAKGLSGYDVAIIRRPVAETFVLYRVEIARLDKQAMTNRLKTLFSQIGGR